MTGESNEDIAPTATGDLLARLKQVLESTNTVVWEVDLDRMEADYFGPVEEVTGLPPAALTDPLAVNEQTTHPEDRETVAEAFGRCSRGRRRRSTWSTGPTPSTARTGGSGYRGSASPAPGTRRGRSRGSRRTSRR